MARAKDTLHKLAVQPSKRRGQNFVISGSVISSLLEFAHFSADERLIEIGPGLGALTAEFERIAPLTVIEIEEKFCREISGRFPHVTVVHADACQVDYSQFAGATIVGNLPYSFSTDIVSAVIGAAPSLKRAVFMLQREFVERMAAEPGTRQYGTLSVYCRLWCDMRLGPVVAGSSFHPPTAVESRLIELQFLSSTRVECGEPDWFRKVVKACFHSRRRTLANSLVASGIAPREDVACALSRAGIDPMRRAETLNLQEFVAVSGQLAKIRAL